MPTNRVPRIVLTARLLLVQPDTGKILFLQQTAKNGGGFTLPGGKVEQAEFAREALVRETYEETGLKVLKKDVEMVHLVHRRMPKTTEIIFFFRSTTFEGTPEVREPLKFQHVDWYGYDQMPEKQPLVLEYVLKRMSKGKTYSEFPRPEKKVKSKKKAKKQTNNTADQTTVLVVENPTTNDLEM